MLQARDKCDGQSSMCGKMRSTARDARAGFDCKTTRIVRAGMWGHAGDLPEKGDTVGLGGM